MLDTVKYMWVQATGQDNRTCMRAHSLQGTLTLSILSI